MYVNGVLVNDLAVCSQDEIKRYIDYVQSQTGGAVAEITINPHGDGVRIDYALLERKFERIRRITGYLVGTIDRWNNAKKSEERERVKHA